MSTAAVNKSEPNQAEHLQQILALPVDQQHMLLCNLLGVDFANPPSMDDSLLELEDFVSSEEAEANDDLDIELALDSMAALLKHSQDKRSIKKQPYISELELAFIQDSAKKGYLSNFINPKIIPSENLSFDYWTNATVAFTTLHRCEFPIMAIYANKLFSMILVIKDDTKETEWYWGRRTQNANLTEKINEACRYLQEMTENRGFRLKEHLSVFPAGTSGHIAICIARSPDYVKRIRKKSVIDCPFRNKSKEAG